MNSISCSAIRSRNVIRFFYDGGSRTAEPFCHGASRAGNDFLRVYQIGGHCESGNPDCLNNANISYMLLFQISKESDFNYAFGRKGSLWENKYYKKL